MSNNSLLRNSSQYSLHDFPADIRQSSTNPVMVKRQPAVIDPQCPQDRRVKVVPADALLGGFPADFVGAAVGESGLDPGAGEPDGEAGVVVISTQGDSVTIGLYIFQHVRRCCWTSRRFNDIRGN